MGMDQALIEQKQDEFYEELEIYWIERCDDE